jgi:beta-glucosidase-like glycosyl hydrolase
VHILLAPGMNIYRSPLCGRNFEYLGEDPYLASRMVVSLVRGVQSQGVAATLKHFACNNQEYDRHKVSSDLDERTLREIYLPAFRAGVVEARAACVMSAYNLINGAHCTEHGFLNNTILKGEWGFDGVLMSDWGATYTAVAAANGGLDLEMPVGDHFNPSLLSPAVQSGQVAQSVIDDKVRRILRTIVRMGFLDRPQKDAAIPLDDPFSAAAALDVAREGVVLLKNQGPLLPLDRSRLKSLVVVGRLAHPGVPAGGGSSFTTPLRPVSLFEDLRNSTGPDVRVTHLPSLRVPTIQFEHEDEYGFGQPGLHAEYFTNRALLGQPALRRVDEQIDFDWGQGSPDPALPNDSFSVRWTGLFQVGQSGRFRIEARSDDGIRVYLDGTRVIDDWSDHAARTATVDVDLELDRTYELRVEYYENSGSALAGLFIKELVRVGGVLEHLDAQGQPKAGLSAEYFNNMTLTAPPAVQRVDSDLDFEWGYGTPAAGVPADRFSVRWTGQIRFEQSGRYQLEVRADDGIRLYLDGKLVIDDWSDHAARSAGVTRWFERGPPYQLKVEYYENGGEATAQLHWWPVVTPEAVRTADAVVVAAGFDSATEGEGWDRTFQLPAGQDDLIAQVLEANPRTVVILFGGGAVDMQTWLDTTPAVIHAWYPGQSGGKALAEVLFGDVNPSGKLPATLEKRWEDNPAYPHYYAPSGGATRYDEGVFVGYRGFDRAGVEPLFPFGYGLSYTTFEYSGLEIAPSEDARGGRVLVSFTVKNTGARGGAETAQLYVQPLNSPIERPLRELEGFFKAPLQAGESKRVTIELEETAFAYFDAAQRSWRVAPGSYEILIGASSRDIRLQGRVEVPRKPRSERRR